MQEARISPSRAFLRCLQPVSSDLRVVDRRRRAGEAAAE